MRAHLMKDAGVSFEKALAKELDEVTASRAARSDVSEEGVNGGPVKSDEEVYAQAHAMDLIGLAFSGGGIRSATFNLGVLQALARRRLLRSFDYLSTVSGGGYIGSWLTAWISRAESIREVEAALAPEETSDKKLVEPQAVRFLRKFSNYLTPKMGMFSSDTWAIISTYLRNLSLNLTIFLLFFAAVFMVPHLIVWSVKGFIARFSADTLLVFLSAMSFLAFGVFSISLNQTYWSIKAQKASEKIHFPWYTHQASILALIVLPLCISAAIAGVWLAFFRESYEPQMIYYSAGAVTAYFASWIAGWIAAQWYGHFAYLPRREATARSRVVDFATAAGDAFTAARSRIREKIRSTAPRKIGHTIGTYLCCMLVSAAAGGGFLALLVKLFRYWEHPESFVWYVVTFGMPLVVLVFMAIMTLQIGLMGRSLPDESREWWSRLGGWLFIVMIGWTALCVFAFFGLPGLAWTKIVGAGVLGSGWVISTIVGVFAGKSPATGAKGSNRLLEFIAKAAPYVFVLGLLLAFSLIVYAVTPLTALEDQAEALEWRAYWGAMWQGTHSFQELVITNFYLMNFMRGSDFLSAFLISLVAALVFSWRIDTNQFSIHLLYRNRLTRCYLGASNFVRSPQPATGLDPRDDVDLSSLARRRAGQTGRPYPGPYPIINTTLNLVAGKELAWQQRKAASFVFTPRYCGYEFPAPGAGGTEKIGCYQLTREHLRDNGGVLLGEAMAISGAAASPNMGYHSSSPLAFLMTIFNVRLGWWIGNPRYRDVWLKSRPTLGLAYLLKELFGLTDDESRFVYLSDGGHFENLGVYELVRRRCRTIIVSDAGCDPDFTFEDLGNAIRKVRVDHGISIDIDLTPIREGKKHCAIGTIRYSARDGEHIPDGTLVYLKPVLCGKEPADVLNYATAAADTRFPHQATADQWFDEKQFESYRMLGYHTVGQICEGVEKVNTLQEFVKQVKQYVR